MATVADRYRRNAAAFTARVEAVPTDRWVSPSPCPGWDARAVVGHVVETTLHFLGRVSAAPEAPLRVEDGPAPAWAQARDAMQAVLDDPTLARAEYEGELGRFVVEESADRFMSTDLVVHAWDLARATGGDERLDPEEAEVVLDQMRAMEAQYGDAMRSAGGFGPALDPPSGADAQARMLAFLGRDPR